MNLQAHFYQAVTTPSDISEHLVTFVDCAQKREAKTVIELGTRGGVSTIAWLYAMDTTDGHLWSVDIDPPPALKHERWTFIQGDDTDPKVIRELPTADFVFVDTSHHYLHTLAELNIYSLKVRPGGLMFLHDTELARPEFSPRTDPRFPVKTAIEEFCRDEGFEWENHPHNNGLGIIHIPE